jgi:hypothetical protein
MKTIELTQDRPTLNDVLQFAEAESVMLRTEDGREYLVVEVDDLEHEVELIQKNPELQQLIEERWKDTTSVPIDEVRRRLGL